MVGLKPYQVYVLKEGGLKHGYTKALTYKRFSSIREMSKTEIDREVDRF